MDLNEIDKYYTENLTRQDSNSEDYDAGPNGLLTEDNDVTKTRLKIYDSFSGQDPRLLLMAALVLQTFSKYCLKTLRLNLWISAGSNNTRKIVIMQKTIRGFVAYKRAMCLKLAQHWSKKQRDWYKEWRSMGRDQKAFSDRSLKTASNIWLWQATDPEVPVEYATCVLVCVHLFPDAYTSFIHAYRAWKKDQDKKRTPEIGQPERQDAKGASEPQFKKAIAPESFFWVSRSVVNRIQKILTSTKKAEEERVKRASEFDRQCFETQTLVLLSGSSSNRQGGRKTKEVKSRLYDGIGTGEGAQAKREAVERRNNQISALTTTPWFEVDVDSDNKVDSQELMRLMQQRGIMCDKRDIEALMAKFDTSKDGMISKQERDSIAAALVQKQHGSGGQVILRGRPSPITAKKQAKSDQLIHEGSPVGVGGNTRKTASGRQLKAASSVKKKGAPVTPAKDTKAAMQSPQMDPFQSEAVRRRRRYLKALSHCVWSEIDQNSDGVLTWGEIEDVLTELDGGVGPGDVADIIAMLDTNKDGVISKGEYHSLGSLKV
uniref:EF-hand domain-containing protein n=1 Tax=Eutreptiella gymnastica TaxID=73025 RepID=A0A7S1I3X1_9EUGL|mmetsp:Transcript_128347/g.221697  ORF Transcript_128347/g.221697 Transcript_128347/m.221697 type:complete len:545 (+) Transcript_128347:100-1734(+)